MTTDARDLMRGLDARERAVLIAIYEHKVLVTEHLKAMFFGSLRRAQDRLRHLAQRGLIDTWYPPQPRGMGKASGHHRLPESSAQVVASLLGVARSELRYVVRDQADREQDSYLAHRLGVNEFFCALIEAGRANDGHGLAKWVPERTVKTSDGWIRPDGFGVYLHPGGALDFYLEYDRGTETTRQLANKLAGYIGVARDWTEQGAELFPSVLIVVPKHKRERVVTAAFADALARFKRGDKLVNFPFYVANEGALNKHGVLGRVWAPLPKLDRRLTITGLPAKEGLDYDLSDSIGRCFTMDGNISGRGSRRCRAGLAFRSESRQAMTRSHPMRGWSPDEKGPPVRCGRDRPRSSRGSRRAAGPSACRHQALSGGGGGEPKGSRRVRARR